MSLSLSQSLFSQSLSLSLSSLSLSLSLSPFLPVSLSIHFSSFLFLCFSVSLFLNLSHDLAFGSFAQLFHDYFKATIGSQTGSNVRLSESAIIIITSGNTTKTRPRIILIQKWELDTNMLFFNQKLNTGNILGLEEVVKRLPATFFCSFETVLNSGKWPQR